MTSVSLHESVGNLVEEASLEEALSQCETALIEFPDDVRLKSLKGQILRKLCRYNEQLEHLEALVEARPKNVGAKVQLASACRLAGKGPQAAALLEEVLAANPDRVDALLERVNWANRFRNAEEALALSEAALARFPDNLRLKLRTANLLFRLGRTDECRQLLEASLVEAPENPETKVDLAKNFRLLGRTDDARTLLLDVLAGNPGHHGATAAMCELAATEGNLDEALHLANAATDRREFTSAPYRICVKALLEQGAAQKALEFLEGQPDRLGDDATIGFLRVETLHKLNRFEDANGLLEKLVTEPQVYLPPPHAWFNLCHALKRPDLCVAIAERELGNGNFADPFVRFILQQGLSQSAITHEPPATADWPERLFPDIYARVRDDFLFDQGHFQKSSHNLRARYDGQRTPHECVLLARSVFGLGRCAPATRYLRRCLRKWPADKEIANALFAMYIKTGQIQEATNFLKALEAKSVFSSRFLWNMYAMLMIHSGRAAELADKSASGHMGNQALHAVWRQLLAVHDGQDREVFEQFASWIPLSNRMAVHRNATLDGQLLTELRLTEFNASSDAAPAGHIAALRETVRANPHSTVPALRLVTQFSKCGDTSLVPEGVKPPGPIPRTIYQYWDAEDPPESVLHYTGFWRAADGYEHKLLNKRTAAETLRKEFGPRWVRAFQLARNPAEAADMLRLCLLARYGGVWADADDALYGDLDALIGGHQGFLAYREPVGGAVANNFLAASPGHPILRRAALMARNSLLRNDNDSTWLKTGPGLLTRAVAIYLAACRGKGLPPDVSLLAGHELCAHVLIHNTMPHKKSGRYWNAKRESHPDIQPLLNSLRETGTAAQGVDNRSGLTQVG